MIRRASHTMMRKFTSSQCRHHSHHHHQHHHQTAASTSHHHPIHKTSGHPKEEQCCRNSSSSASSCIEDNELSKCWNCEEKHHCSTLFCTQCHKIQPPPSQYQQQQQQQHRQQPVMNHFQLFHVPKRYNVNEHQLDTKYKQLQMLLHPDRFENKSEVERKLSAVQSSLVTHAYQTLKNPKLRAEYLLSLEGQKVDESDVDQMFLMEVMEMNEILNEEEVSQSQLKQYMRENEAMKEQVGKEFSDSMLNKDYVNARKSAAKLNYLVRIRDTIYEMLDTIHQRDDDDS
jgi:molecular chaperone HscB